MAEKQVMQIIEEVNKKVEGLNQPTILRSRSKRQDQPTQISMNQQSDPNFALKQNERAQKLAKEKLGSKSLA